MQIIINLLINGFAVFVTSKILTGVRVDSFLTAVIVAVVLGAVNTFIKPLAILFTLPITILTLGLFAFVINAMMVLLVDYLIPGFEVRGFWWALLFSFVLSLIGSILYSLKN